MTDDTVTGWKTKLLRVWGLLCEYAAVSVPAGCFLLGIVVGWVLL